MIFRPIDHETDIYGPEAAQLVFRELFGIGQVRDDPTKLYKSMTDGWDNYCLENVFMPGLAAVGSLDLTDTYQGLGIARIENVVVKPKYRSEGIGRFLLGALEDEARQQGASVVRLASLNSAEGFYKKLGYELYCDVNPLELIKEL